VRSRIDKGDVIRYDGVRGTELVSGRGTLPRG